MQGFQAHLQRTIELGKTFEEQVVKDDNFEIVTPRSLSLVVFRLKPKGEDLDEEALNALNKKFYARLHKHTSIQLSEHGIFETSGIEADALILMQHRLSLAIPSALDLSLEAHGRGKSMFLQRGRLFERQEKGSWLLASSSKYQSILQCIRCKYLGLLA